ncbi:MAG TPA: heavy metal translocating P-type ATPase [Planctomycetaceae bacterium]|nr:heavy metal translocating P-type ATPase [Planctomycetaceae bacterium]
MAVDLLEEAAEAESSGANRRQAVIASGAILGIAAHLVLRFGFRATSEAYHRVNWAEVPLLAVLFLGGLPLVLDLLRKLFRLQFGSDLLAGMSIVTSAILGEYLAGSLVVLMLSGGEALEAFAVRNASSVLQALARRMPTVAHRRMDGRVEDVAIGDVTIGDVVVVFPHEACPIDGTVVDGHGVMDESYLTGEPYQISKAPGAQVLSGALNGESALTIRADRLAVDSRYAKIMQVMRDSEQRRPRMRRLGDQLGAIYTPLAVGIALAAWAASGQSRRFLAVLVVATPCPLLIAIPVAIIGAISLAARRGIIIKDPVVLEKIETCRTAIFDKTGTLTYGAPKVTETIAAGAHTPEEVLRLAASVERYSKHPLAGAIVEAAEHQKIVAQEAVEISERPGEGLRGMVDGVSVRITSRKSLLGHAPDLAAELPEASGTLECIILVDDRLAGVMRFRDEPRREGASFITHLLPKHRFRRIMLVSGDRESEVRYLADRVGIRDVYSSQSPEQKLELVREETKRANTLFLGDGINDSPALTAATVGVAFGSKSDVTSEAAGAVILDTSLEKVDEFLHIGRRMRTIALQSAIGGMALSAVGMFFAAAGALPPVAGAIIQEVIDVAAVLNALRVNWRPQSLADYSDEAFGRSRRRGG